MKGFGTSLPWRTGPAEVADFHVLLLYDDVRERNGSCGRSETWKILMKVRVNII